MASVQGRWAWALLLVGLGACGDGENRGETAPDQQDQLDGGATDGEAPDSGPDAGPTDHDGSADAAVVDTGPPELWPVGAARFASGTDGACRILENGTLRCWGAGDGAPVTVMPGSTFVDVALVRPPDRPFVRGCAILTGGGLVCWKGADAAAQVGSLSYTKLALSNLARCGITAQGAIACGSYYEDELAVVVQETGWAYLTAGADHFCALKDTGGLYCWGTNLRGELGLGGSAPLPQQAPNPIMPEATWRDVSAGTWSTCAVRSDGALFCWGSIMQSASVPTRVGTDSDWARVSVSVEHACALKTDGTAHCWGTANVFGQQGFYGIGKATPTAISAETDWSAISVGNNFVCAAKKDKSLRCWGTDGFGQLGRGTSHLRPTKIGGTEWQSVSAGNTSTCAVRTNGTLACWGAAVGYAQLGQTPQAIGAETKWKNVRVGKHESSACVTDAANALYCWGAHLGSFDADANLPTSVGLTVKDFSLATSHACAITQDDAMYCWGNADVNGLETKVSVPTVVGADKWRSVAAAYNDTCAVRADGTLWCWGSSWDDPSEQVGSSNQWTRIKEAAGDSTFFGLLSGNITAVVRPSGIDPVSDVVELAFAGRNQCVIQSSGSLLCAGDNLFGEVGDGTTVAKNTPGAIGSNADWKLLTAGETHFCGIRGAGDLYCWGRNDYGQIGDGSAYSATPVRVLD